MAGKKTTAEWMSRRHFCDKYNQEYKIEFDRLTGILDGLRDQFSQDILADYRFSEKVENKIVSILKNQKSAPEGWRTPWQISKDFPGVGHGNVRRYAETFRSIPQWFGWYLNGSQTLCEYLAPPLIQEIERYIESIKAPEDWRYIADLCRELNRSASLFRPVIREHRKSNPEWFRPYHIFKRGGFKEHLSPEMVVKIKEEDQRLHRK